MLPANKEHDKSTKFSTVKLYIWINYKQRHVSHQELPYIINKVSSFKPRSVFVDKYVYKFADYKICVELMIVNWLLTKTV